MEASDERQLEPIERLAGTQLVEHLTTDGTVVFRYLKNVRGLVFLLVVASILFGIGLIAYYGNDLSRFWSFVVFGFFIIPAMLITTFVVYWNRYADRNLLALSRQWLFVGSRRQGYRINLHALTLENVGFDKMHDSATSVTLEIKVSSKTIPLRLSNPFTYIDNLPDFIAYLLTRVKENSKDSESSKKKNTSKKNTSKKSSHKSKRR